MNEDKESGATKTVVRLTRYIIYITLLCIACIIIAATALIVGKNESQGVVKVDRLKELPLENSAIVQSFKLPANAWKSPDETTIPSGKKGQMIKYGRELIAHTARYFGPKGTIAKLSNGMNCQNCHLDAGTRLFGNNYSSFIATYPKLSGRAGKVEPASERLVECFERSLNGRAPDTTKKEVQAMLAYMSWLGKDVKHSDKAIGSGTEKLPFFDIAADPAKGKTIYVAKCQSCHGQNGEGLVAADGKSYTYPPVWGKHSYNDGAGMYRLTNLAGFVKNNMPYGATYQNPQLTNEEAWNVAAFIDSQPRPHKDQTNDWKDLSKKPIDLPFGPYADSFSEKQHKYGPFTPIKNAQKLLNNR